MAAEVASMLVSSLRLPQSSSLAMSSRSAKLRQNEPLPAEDVDELLKGGLVEILDVITDPPEPDEDQPPKQLVLWDYKGHRISTALVRLLSEQSVILHVYDLNKELQKVNHVMAATVGGAFHVGVECFGSEWSYGVHGVCAEPARTATGHVYRGSIYLGRTTLQAAAFAQVVLRACQRWTGAEYQLLGHNCCNFADYFCARLGSYPVPAWVSSLPRLVKTSGDSSQAAEEWSDSDTDFDDDLDEEHAPEDEFSLTACLGMFEDMQVHEAIRLSLQA
eukprot:TRINITY_DN40788_c0_g1_i1.p1 TRINITY_DN40788_c0_g1~~TRINITY_DN40788_c0_g1_i1.p1  ORF type:complete len:276 (-),score=52.84 TRINITY_DN40788_c0_g1_i1:34-861(-)